MRRVFFTPAALASVTLVLVLLLGAVFLLLQQSGKDAGLVSQPETVAYMIPTQGAPEVRRQQKTIALSTATLLRSSDELRFQAGSIARFILPRGMGELRGPEGLLVKSLPSKVISSDAGAASAAGLAASKEAAEKLQATLFPRPGMVPSFPMLLATRGVRSIPLYSPLRSTVHLNPLVLWKSEPGKTYDVTIIDEFNSKQPPLQLSGTVSPVAFDRIDAWKGRKLAANGLYRLILQEHGKPFTACEYSFRTLKAADPVSPSSPQDKLLNAYKFLSLRSGSTW